MKNILPANSAQLLVVCLITLLIACTEAPKKETVIKKVKAVKVGELSGIEQRSFPGKAQAIEEAILSFRISGQMIARNVNNGDIIEMGDVLASLDDTDFKNSVAIAEGVVAETEAAYLDASRNYQRLLDIKKTDPEIISQVMIDNAQAHDSITRAANASAKAALKLAEDRLSYSHIKAPFSGEVVATYVEAHETIIAKQKIVKIINSDAMEFTFDVPESLISYANQVIDAVVILDIQPDVSLPAKIKEISREASQSTRTYPVTLFIENTEAFKVLPGMAGKAYLKASLPGNKEFSGFDIPASALFSDGELTNSFVWVVVDNKVVKRAVEVLRPTDYGIKVSEGLEQGEWLIVAGVHSLVEGQQVRILDATSGKE
ncbi:efflux RND transporter periplasmic adaptor subunit [Thalassotalea psychrophila]|uniref:Efflux RND transporter periplasmic adaptor subunit n=1 Tax=Thalassotalea psychrophila TaxID=3065647 RepID=A0ABY9TZ80_9GAMM|nr:efflux RND transporter periplasmic adaptor subunit [Colwelliaceae bacterium SQ149]